MVKLPAPMHHDEDKHAQENHLRSGDQEGQFTRKTLDLNLVDRFRCILVRTGELLLNFSCSDFGLVVRLGG